MLFPTVTATALVLYPQMYSMLSQEKISNNFKTYAMSSNQLHRPRLTCSTHRCVRCVLSFVLSLLIYTEINNLQ